MEFHILIGTSNFINNSLLSNILLEPLSDAFEKLFSPFVDIFCLTFGQKGVGNLLTYFWHSTETESHVGGGKSKE